MKKIEEKTRKKKKKKRREETGIGENMYGRVVYLSHTHVIYTLEEYKSTCDRCYICKFALLYVSGTNTLLCIIYYCLHDCYLRDNTFLFLVIGWPFGRTIKIRRRWDLYKYVCKLNCSTLYDSMGLLGLVRPTVSYKSFHMDFFWYKHHMYMYCLYMLI